MGQDKMAGAHPPLGGYAPFVKGGRLTADLNRFANVMEEIKIPAVKDLNVLDDEFLELEREHEKACLELKEKYEAKYAELLQRRGELLSAVDSKCVATPATTTCSREAKATPALTGFWRQVLQNSNEFCDDIEKHDEPVLDYLKDVQTEWLDRSARKMGFRIRFIFAPNPYFSTNVIEKVYHTQRKNVYCARLECIRVETTKIEWHAGKNVTVDVISKKPKGGSRRRQAKPRKEEVPRASLFRSCFRNLGPDDDIPEEELMDSDGDESEDLMEILIDDDFERGVALRDRLVPHAIRWYTGEACDDDDGGESETLEPSVVENDEDEDEEEEDDEDDDESDDEEHGDDEDEHDGGTSSGCKVHKQGEPRKLG